jgi:hypothetical protein
MSVAGLASSCESHEWYVEGFGCPQSPARYLGNEFGAVRPAWESADVRFSLTYPESYEVGASNLGHIILYSVLNDSPGLLCDRAYFPGKCSVCSPPRALSANG